MTTAITRMMRTSRSRGRIKGRRKGRRIRVMVRKNIGMRRKINKGVKIRRRKSPMIDRYQDFYYCLLIFSKK